MQIGQVLLEHRRRHDCLACVMINLNAIGGEDFENLSRLREPPNGLVQSTTVNIIRLIAGGRVLTA